MKKSETNNLISKDYFVRVRGKGHILKILKSFYSHFKEAISATAKAKALITDKFDLKMI